MDAICLWCTSVHVLTLLLFISTVFGTVATAPAPRFEEPDLEEPPPGETTPAATRQVGGEVPATPDRPG